MSWPTGPRLRALTRLIAGVGSAAALRPSAAALLALLHEHAPLWVITEPGATHLDAWPTSAVSQLGDGSKRHWVAVVGDAVEPIELLPKRVQAAAGLVRHEDTTIAVYGTVLPWNSVKKDAPEFLNGETMVNEIFAGVVSEQRTDLQRLAEKYDHVVWAGDFNQNLTGAHAGAGARRLKLQSALDELHMTAFNDSEPHQIPGITTIDLICGTAGLQLRDSRRRDVGRLSKGHDIYVVGLLPIVPTAWQPQGTATAPAEQHRRRRAVPPSTNEAKLEKAHGQSTRLDR